MQAYGRAFAQVYNTRWSGFAENLAPHLLAFYERTPIHQEFKDILDLCCGTGQMARYFLDHGYQVTGLDLSPHMLHYARENTGDYLESGQAEFLEADAANFVLDKRFGLVISVFDSLNHLPNEQALNQCLASVFAVLAQDGIFVFDLNTRLGLRRWNGIQVHDTETLMLVTRGIYDGRGDKAWTSLSGFIQNPDGRYERFEETVYNTVFETARVRQALLDTGWRDVYFARYDRLDTPIEDPEEQDRIFFIATK